MARLVSLGILSLLIIFLGITFYQVVAPFLLPLFLAGVVSIVCQPIYRRYLEWTGDRAPLAAGLTAASAMAAFLIPAILVTIFATGELLGLAQQIRTSPEFRETIRAVQSEPYIERVAHQVQPLLGAKADEKLIAQEIERGIQEAIAEVAKKTLGIAGAALSFLGSVFTGFIGIGMFLIALYYFLKDSTRLLNATENLVPVKIDYQRQLFRQFEKSVRAVVVATFFAATAQGICTTVALYFLGFHRFFLLLSVTTLVSMIPLAGAWLVWAPCAVWLAYTGHWWSAGLLTVYGAVFIGLLDNLIRTYILHTDVKLHPLLAFISVLGGVQVMGLWGVFIAPIVASCLHALILIFNTELKELSKTQFAELRRKFSTRKPRTDPIKSAPKRDNEPAEATASKPSGQPIDASADKTDDPPRNPSGKRRRRRSRKRRPKSD